jgi:hypothetical protein
MTVLPRRLPSQMLPIRLVKRFLVTGTNTTTKR